MVVRLHFACFFLNEQTDSQTWLSVFVWLGSMKNESSIFVVTQFLLVFCAVVLE